MTLLQEIHQETLALQESRRLEMLALLKRTLKQILPPGTQVVVFGSLVSPGRFRGSSDIDLAFRAPLDFKEQTRIAVALEETLRRPVDLLVLGETRDALRAKILREGEPWTA